MRVLVYSTGIVRNELICGYANVLHTSSSFRTHTQHTHTYTQFEDHEPTGLKMDIAEPTGLKVVIAHKLILRAYCCCCCFADAMVSAKVWNECKVQDKQARRQDIVFAYRQKKVFEILILS